MIVQLKRSNKPPIPRASGSGINYSRIKFPTPNLKIQLHLLPLYSSFVNFNLLLTNIIFFYLLPLPRNNNDSSIYPLTLYHLTNPKLHTSSQTHIYIYICIQIQIPYQTNKISTTRLEDSIRIIKLLIFASNQQPPDNIQIKINKHREIIAKSNSIFQQNKCRVKKKMEEKIEQEFRRF